MRKLFSDPMVDCRICRARHRADQLPEKDGVLFCAHCGSRDLTEPRDFNLMFKSHAGPLESEENKVYLRPETAQSIFVNFKNVLETSRHKLPFGIAQIGKAFRNEIVKGNFIFRMVEFEQMEMQYFVKPGTQLEAFEGPGGRSGSTGTPLRLAFHPKNFTGTSTTNLPTMPTLLTTSSLSFRSALKRLRVFTPVLILI